MLDENKSLQESSSVHIANLQVQLIKKTHIISIIIKYNNTLGYFMETPASHSKTVLSQEYSGLFIHRQTTANSIRFTTNELLTLESQILASRELCLQITSELKKYAVNFKRLNIVSVYGGSSIQEQAKSIKKGAQIIVATPGRMLDMIKRNYVNISKITFCVLDEADEMLNMGFYKDIKSILSNTPKSKKTWLFSATMPNEVSKIAEQFMKNPYKITVGEKNSSSINVSHKSFLVNNRNKYSSCLLYTSDAADE